MPIILGTAEELVVLTRNHVISILKRYLSSELSSEDIESWANIIESREDIGYEENFEELLNDKVFELANPLLTESLSENLAEKISSQLKE